jgi:hypothetical protein
MLTLNGRHVIDAVLSFPRTGIWHADVHVDSPDDITGAVILTVGDDRLVLHGTVQTGGNWQDSARLRIVGGKGGLRRIAKPKHYTGISLKIVLSDLLTGAGERLSATADVAGILKRQVDAWTSAALPTGRLITQLLESVAPDATWRVLPDGTVWIGMERWPDSGLAVDDYQVLTENPARAEALLGVELPLLMPGTKLGSRPVSYVEHKIADPEVRTSVWFDEGGRGDRLKAALRGAVKAAQAPIDYLACYLGTVVAQSGSTIDVRPLDLRLPSMAKVPLLGGLPGWKVQVKPGGQVLVGWSGGDPTSPYAFGFSGEVAASRVELLGDAVVLGSDAGAEPVILGATYRAAEDAFLTLMATAIAKLGIAVAALGNSSAATAVADVATGVGTFEGAAPKYLSSTVRSS